jgi:MFS family permease
MSRNRIVLVTLGMMLSLFMASMESTVVSTAMPTIASQLGGLEFYSWVFSAYMLTSTTTANSRTCMGASQSLAPEWRSF